MTDENLIELLRSTSPDKLTGGEVALIHERLAQSEEFRGLLREAIGQDDERSAVLHELRIDPESLLPIDVAPVPNARAGRRGLWLVVLLALVTIGGLWWSTRARQPVNDDDDGDDIAKSVEPEQVPDEVVAQKTASNKLVDTPTETKTDSTSRDHVDNSTDGKPIGENVGQPAVPDLTPVIKPPPPDFDSLPVLIETPQPLETLFAIDQSTGTPGKFDSASGKNIGGFTGTIRLKPKWEQDSLLRCQFDRSSDRFELSFWQGNQGVLVRFYPHRGLSWGVYRVERTGKAPEPVSYLLVDTDSGIYRRVGADQLEVRHQDNHLVIATAGRVLIEVPFQGLPEQLYLSGRARFRAYELVQSGPIPTPSHTPFPLVREINKPADEPWVKQLPEGVDFEIQDDGSVRLKADGPATKGWVALPFDRVGFHEVIYEIQSPTPGTGIFLGSNEPTHPFGFFSETVRRETVLEFALGRSWQTTMRVQERVVPYVDNQVWVKLLNGVESIGVWMSRDGKRWFLACEPIPRRYGTITHFGIYCDQGRMPRELTLKRIEVRELSTIREMADPKLLAQTPSFETADYAHQWFRIAAQAMPANTPIIEWRRACCVKALSQTRAVSLASPVWRDLFRDGLLREDWSQEKKQAFVAEMIRLIPAINRGYPPFPFESFDRLEQQRIQAGQPTLIDAYLKAVRTGPSVSSQRLDFIPIQSMRQQLLADHHAGQSQAVHQRSLDFRLTTRTLDWRDPHRELDRLIEWLHHGVVEERDEEANAALPDSPHNHSVQFASHPLQNVVKKETHNLFAELRANLESGEFEEACKIALQVDGTNAGGLPAVNDPHLFVSLPLAIEAAMQRHDEFRQTMTDKFADRMTLRARQAVGQNNWQVLKQVSRQFPRTEAAAIADAHLGHWHLNSGRFAAAASCYHRAMQIEGADQDALRARYYLAEAMQGRGAKDAVIPATVEFGERTISSDEYARLLDEMREHHQPESADREIQLPMSQPSDVAVQQWSDKPFTAQPKINRGASGVIRDGHMYLDSGLEIVCLDVMDGRRKWRQRFSDGTHTQNQPLSLPNPLFVDGRLITRVEMSQAGNVQRLGPSLVQMDLETGEVIGNPSDPGVLSNPMMREQELWAVTADVTQAGVQFHLTAFDPQTLAVVQRHPLMTTKTFFDQQRYPTFGMSSTNDLSIVTGAGCTVCTNLDGSVRWLRRQPWYPPIDIDREWAKRLHGDPVIRDGLVYVAQPGSAQVECVRVETGELVWQRSFDAPLALIESAHGIVVATGKGLDCLDFKSGGQIWHHANTGISVANLHAVPSSDSTKNSTIVYACLAPTRADRVIPAVVWLNGATGVEVHRSLFGNEEFAAPVLGPFVSDGKDVWLSHATSNDAALELWQLGHTPINCVTPVAEANFNFWAFHPNEHVSKAWKGLFPSWPLVSHRHDNKTIYQREFHSEEAVVVTSMNEHFPTSILREIELPKGPCKLVMRVGHDGAVWDLRVKVGKELIHSQQIGPETATDNWTTVEVDLAKHTGKRIWLLIEAASPKGVIYASWKRLALVR